LAAAREQIIRCGRREAKVIAADACWRDIEARAAGESEMAAPTSWRSMLARGICRKKIRKSGNSSRACDLLCATRARHSIGESRRVVQGGV
jgi:hypothetical protein